MNYETSILHVIDVFSLNVEQILYVTQYAALYVTLMFIMHYSFTLAFTAHKGHMQRKVYEHTL